MKTEHRKGEEVRGLVGGRRRSTAWGTVTHGEALVKKGDRRLSSARNHSGSQPRIAGKGLATGQRGDAAYHVARLQNRRAFSHGHDWFVPYATPFS